MTNTKREQLVAARVPEDLAADLKRIEEVEHLDRSSVVRRFLYKAVQDWKMEQAAKLYQESRATIAKAAEEAGVPVREMMDYVRLKKIPAQYDVEDFEHDLRLVRERSRRAGP